MRFDSTYALSFLEIWKFPFLRDCLFDTKKNEKVGRFLKKLKLLYQFLTTSKVAHFSIKINTILSVTRHPYDNQTFVVFLCSVRIQQC